MNSKPLNAKAAKEMRAKVLTQYPNLEKDIDTLWPKKASIL